MRRVCEPPRANIMHTCKTCHRQGHHGCVRSVLLEAMCNVCSAPKPDPPPPQPKVRLSKEKCCVGLPWLRHQDGLMWCLACREHPQVGIRSSWPDGTPHLHVSTVKNHTKCGLHAKPLALLRGASASSCVADALVSGPVHQSLPCRKARWKLNGCYVRCRIEASV